MLGKATQIFPGGSLYVSHPFKLEDDLIKLALVGLREDDYVTVEYVVGISDCDEKWVKYKPSCCGELKFEFPQGEVFLNVPNRYRLRLSNRSDSHLTDPSWFSNVEIYQTPVTGTNINLEGNCGMSGCSSNVKCGPNGIMVDGVLCVAPDTKITSVITTNNGWTLIQSDGSTKDLNVNPTIANTIATEICGAQAAKTVLSDCVLARLGATPISPLPIGG